MRVVFAGTPDVAVPALDAEHRVLELLLHEEEHRHAQGQAG